MNTTWLAQQVLPRWGVADTEALGAVDALILLRSINAALQEAGLLLPSIYAQVPMRIAFPAPESTTVAVEAGSTTLGAALPGREGRTLFIDGDPQPNRLVSETTLRQDYAGTTGSRMAVIYGDAARLESPISRVITTPTLDTGDELLPATIDILTTPRPHLSRPTHYWIEPAGATQGAEPPFWLRLHPAPAIAAQVSFVADVRPARLTLPSLVTAGQIAFHDGFIEAGLLPLIEAGMTSHTLWADAGTKAEVRERAQAARDFLRSQPASMSTTPNRIGTPPGY
jgi:hypothetical protein